MLLAVFQHVGRRKILRAATFMYAHVHAKLSTALTFENIVRLTDGVFVALPDQRYLANTHLTGIRYSHRVHAYEFWWVP
jgi:hypothetical protein